VAQTFGERQRPWLLAVGIDNDNSPVLHAALDSLIDVTVDYVEHQGDVDESEYDVVIAVEGLGFARENLHVFMLGGRTPDVFQHHQGDREEAYRWEPRSAGRSRQTTIPDDTPEDIAALARASLVPWCDRQQKPYSVLIPSMEYPISYGPDRLVGPSFPAAFLRAASGDGDVIAGRYTRPGGKQCWWLPRGVERIGDWLEVALKHFARQDPARFPVQATGWTDQPEWMTADEQAAARALDELNSEREEAIASLDAREADIRAALDAAREAADGGPRRLLTSQGEDLVDEVEQTLLELGFQVVRPDEERAASKEALLEDLEVLDEEWNTLAEVRGYTRGAKTSDLQRIERFVGHYVRRTGHLPSARWYVVNHLLAQPPDGRPAVLRGAEEDVALFAEAQGLVIDTRDLYRLRRAVADGRTTAEWARNLLRSSAGVLSYGRPDQE
jgi:hypothetical protein